MSTFSRLPTALGIVFASLTFALALYGAIRSTLAHRLARDVRKDQLERDEWAWEVEVKPHHEISSPPSHYSIIVSNNGHHPVGFKPYEIMIGGGVEPQKWLATCIGHEVHPVKVENDPRYLNVGEQFILTYETTDLYDVLWNATPPLQIRFEDTRGRVNETTINVEQPRMYLSPDERARS